MTGSSNEKNFMRETIVKPKETKSHRAGRAFCLVLFAVILGIVSAVSFVISIPFVIYFFRKPLSAADATE